MPEPIVTGDAFGATFDAHIRYADGTSKSRLNIHEAGVANFIYIVSKHTNWNNVIDFTISKREN